MQRQPPRTQYDIDRLDLGRVTFVVFCRDRPHETRRLLEFLVRHTTHFNACLYDNGKQSILPVIKDVVVKSVSYVWAPGDFAAQHAQAASTISTDYAMLVDDDGLPALDGIKHAMLLLDIDKSAVAVFGRRGEFSGLGTVSVPEDSPWRWRVNPLASPNAARRVRRHLGLRYTDRFWYAVNRTEAFSRSVRRVGQFRPLQDHSSQSELFFEALMAFEGRALDLGEVLYWDCKDVESLRAGVEKISVSSYWNSQVFEQSRRRFIDLAGQIADWPTEYQRVFSASTRRFARGRLLRKQLRVIRNELKRVGRPIYGQFLDRLRCALFPRVRATSFMSTRQSEKNSASRRRSAAEGSFVDYQRVRAFLQARIS